MSAPKPPPYVARATSYWSRVTLTAELPKRTYGRTAWFLGEFQGEAVAVEVYEVPDILALRRALTEHGAVLFDSPAYRVDLATPEQVAAAPARPDETPIPLSDGERDALAKLRRLGPA